MKKLKIYTTILTISALLSSCSYKPILDQNEKYFQVGQEESQKDIDQCTADGDEYLKQYKAQRAIKEAGRKALTGAVIGAATGFIFGNNLKSLAIGTAIGAGVGAAAGGLGVAGEGKVSPDHIKQRYISNCLARKGYQVIGWQ